MPRRELPVVIHRPADPALLATAIPAALAATPLLRVHAVRGSAAAPEPWANAGIPRLTMVLEGTRAIAWPEARGTRVHHLAAGEVMLVCPSGWSHPRPGAAHRYCCIDCYPDVTRFHLESMGTPAREGEGSFITAAPLLPANRHLLQAMTILAEQGVESRLLPLLRCFVEEVLEECREPLATVPGQDAWQQAVVWANDHLALGIGREQIAAAAGVHPNHLSRLCRRFSGQSLSEYLTELRMTRARELLLTTDLPVEQVVSLAGYHDETHFRKRFKAVCGQTPGAWRRRGQGV